MGPGRSIKAVGFIAFFQLFWPCRSLNIKPLPKHNVADLPLDTFDSIYNDKLPVIIRGSSACPRDFNFSNIHQFCKGQIPLSFVHTKSKSNETHWAGLMAGDIQETIDFETFVGTMGTTDDLRFMFDLPMVEVCPTLPPQVQIPPHFVNMFSSHFLYRHLSDETNKNDSAEWKRLCPKLPFFNMYLAEGGFETDLHIDAMHSAFLASMCVGRKLWRVMTSSDFDKVYDQIGKDGMKINGTWVMSSVISPIDTWSKDGLLQGLDVDIYEGILEPGEILYIPQGSPHAATTLDQSLMVASNDRTIQSMTDLKKFCTLWLKEQGGEPGLFSAACKDVKRQFPLIQKNQRLYTSQVQRQEMTLAKATGCETTFDLLSVLEEHKDNTSRDILFLTPENFRDEISKGPLIVMKSQNVAGICLYLLKNWNKWTQGYDPPIRVAVISCVFQYQCVPGKDPFYQQLLDEVESKPTPTLLYIESPANFEVPGNPTLSFYSYYGFYALDDIRIWASVQTKSMISWEDDGKSAGRKIMLLVCHRLMKEVDYFTNIFGPSLLGFLIAAGLLAVAFGCLFFWAWVLACFYDWKNRFSRVNPLDKKVKDN